MDWLKELLLTYEKYTRTDAIGMVDDNGDEVLLSEVYGNLIANYQAMSNIAKVKAPAPLGQAGSYEYDRFQNATVNTYGTARTAGEGSDPIDDKVTVNVNTHKEIVEEVQLFDARRLGVGNVINKRSINHVMRMVATLDRAAFTALKAAAAASGSASDYQYANGTTPNYLDLMEQVVVALETTTNDYIDGLDRSMIVVFLKPSIYSKVQQALDTVYAYDGSTGIKEVPGYHGYQVVSEKYLPSATDFIVTIVNNVAQPIESDGYTEGERIPFSKAMEVSLFFDYGTSILMPELVYEGEFTEAAA